MSSPKRRTESPAGLAALAAVVLGACCGIPLLLSAGATVTIAGLAIGNWFLGVAGLCAAVFAVIWHRRRHEQHQDEHKESVRAN